MLAIQRNGTANTNEMGRPLHAHARGSTTSEYQRPRPATIRRKESTWKRFACHLDVPLPCHHQYRHTHIYALRFRDFEPPFTVPPLFTLRADQSPGSKILTRQSAAACSPSQQTTSIFAHRLLPSSNSSRDAAIGFSWSLNPMMLLHLGFPTCHRYRRKHSSFRSSLDPVRTLAPPRSHTLFSIARHTESPPPQ